MKKIPLILFSLFLLVDVAGQEESPNVPLTFGADLVNRYIFRGLDFGSSPAIQPSLVFSTGNFTLGAWGSYAFVASPAGIEADLYAFYSFDFGLSVGITDYYFPSERLKIDQNVILPVRSGKYFDYAHHHYLELNATQSLGSFRLNANYGFLNLDHAVYLEAGYALKWADLFVGAGNGLYSLSGKFNVVNVGIKASREVALTKDYSFSLSSSLILNPNAEQIHLVFCLSL